MTFTLSTIRKPNLSASVDREIKHESGINLTLTVKHDPEFNAAFAKAQAELAQKPLLKNALKRGQQSELTQHEALIFIIGEYVISDWNVENEHGEKVKPSGDALLSVCEVIAQNQEQLVDFLTELTSKLTSAMDEFKQKIEAVKKKR